MFVMFEISLVVVDSNHEKGRPCSSFQTRMRGLRACGATWLALAVLLNCIAPSGVTAVGFDAASQGRQRAQDKHRSRTSKSSPTVSSLFPTTVHVVGGAKITIKGVGFLKSDALAVRFSNTYGDINTGGGPLHEVVPATFISSTEIQCEAPKVSHPLLAHVSVTNGDGVFSSAPGAYIRGNKGGNDRGGFTGGTNALTLEFLNQVPGCPGCGFGGFQSDKKTDPKNKVRERWVVDTDVGTDVGGGIVTVKTIGYAVNSPTDPFNESLTHKLEELDEATRESLGFGESGFYSSQAPTGGPGARGRGGSVLGGVSPMGKNYGPKPRGTFLPGPGLTCVFRCPVEVSRVVTVNGVDTVSTTPLPDAVATSQVFTRGPSSSRTAAHYDALRFTSALRHEEATGIACNLSDNVLDELRLEYVDWLEDGKDSNKRINPPTEWIDYTTVQCAVPAFPKSSTVSNATQNVTVSRDCHIHMSNDFGETFDAEGPMGDRGNHTHKYANAARVAFRYSNKIPTLLGDIQSSDGVGTLLKTSATTTNRNLGMDSLGVTARGPLSGNTEIKIGGKDFIENVPTTACAFSFGNDSFVGPRRIITSGKVLDANTVVCVSPSQRSVRDDISKVQPGVGDAGVSGVTSSDTPTTKLSSSSFPPVLNHEFGKGCFFSSVEISNDGTNWSSQRALFLYCDVYVSPLGGHVDFDTAFGTPTNPFPNLQSALAAGLRGARVKEFGGGGADESKEKHFPKSTGSASRGVASFGTSGGKETIARSGSERTGGGYGSSFGAWVNRDVIRLNSGSYGGEGDLHLSVAADQVITVNAVGDAHDDDVFLFRRLNTHTKNPEVTISCGDASHHSPLFVTRDTSIGKAPVVGADGRPIGNGGAVSFSSSIFLSNCFQDGEVFHAGMRCVGGSNRGCAGDSDVRSGNVLGGSSRDPSNWEAFDYDDEAEYFVEEEFYDFV